jgi:nicotinate-nucleotide--dimethylbenzimidazole phosphoribosyltransferase
MTALSPISWLSTPCPQRQEKFKIAAIERQTQLTKPAGSLGQLEALAIQLADLQQTESPAIDKIAIAIFAGDHGITEEGVSAFPQEVTVQMVMNFIQGGAAISVLAKQLGAQFEVVDTGIASVLPKQKGLVIQRAGNGTANCLHQAAMTESQLKMALQAGHDSVKRAVKNNADLFIGGEMGISNTTSATILYCALMGLTPEQATGAGTGLDSTGITHKTMIVEKVLNKHQIECGNDALAWLRCVGGFEIVALTGAYIAAAQSGLTILVDGFITSVSALCAVKINPQVNDYMIFSHISAEQAHRKVLETLEQSALLDLGMRLGEGSGAAVAVPLLQAACTTHNEMATFAEAMVATQS